MLSTVGHTVIEINWFSLLGYMHTASISVKYQFIALLFFLNVGNIKLQCEPITVWTDLHVQKNDHKTCEARCHM